MMDLHGIPKDVVDSYLLFPDRDRFIPVAKNIEDLIIWAIDDIGVKQGSFLGWMIGSPVKIKKVNKEEFSTAIEKGISLWDNDAFNNVDEYKDQDINDNDIVGWSYDDAPIVKMVNKLLYQGVSAGASDIHFEPQEDSLIVKFRVDGDLDIYKNFSKSVQTSILSRLKVLADMDVAETRIPQDGRIRVKIRDSYIDFRASTMPTLLGEKAVLRILDKNKGILSLSKLGFVNKDIEKIRHSLSRPYGIVLVTGPTGSGKTTTLYSALSEKDTKALNIMTIEDPVEYHLPGINQVQINNAAGVTFASAVRGFLRQDPDIILIGEIRDEETANIAIQASLTGHLVLATLHTNDAPSAITRLVDIGVEPFMLSSSLSLVIGQRLVRRNCQSCKKEIPIDNNKVSSLFSVDVDIKTHFKSVGCKECAGNGYNGRLCLSEVLDVNDNVKSFIVKNNDSTSIGKCAEKYGYKNLSSVGIELVKKGLISFDELLRVTKY